MHRSGPHTPQLAGLPPHLPIPDDHQCGLQYHTLSDFTADALHGYWQMDLVEEDRHLTNFIMPYGRFQHCQGPMGFAVT